MSNSNKQCARCGAFVNPLEPGRVTRCPNCNFPLTWTATLWWAIKVILLAIACILGVAALLLGILYAGCMIIMNR